MSLILDKGIFLIQSFETAADYGAPSNIPIKLPPPANLSLEEPCKTSIFRTTEK
jgi:hypothetical protein